MSSTSLCLLLMGRGQAVFFFDNRRIYDLLELDRLSSVDIESIEMIANPGSEYDASVKTVVRVATYANFARGLSVDARSTWYQNRNASVVEQLGLRYSAQRWTAYNNLEYRSDNDLTWKDLTQTVYADTLWNEVSNEQEHLRHNRIENTTGIDWQIGRQSYVGGRYMLTYDTYSRMDLSSDNSVYADGRPYDQLLTTGLQRGHGNRSLFVNAYYSGAIGGFKANADFDYLHSTTETDNEYDEASRAGSSCAFTAVSRVNNRMMSLRASAGRKLWRGDATVGVEYVRTRRNDNYLSTLDEMPTAQSLLKETQRAAFADYSVLTRVGLFGLGVRVENARFTFHPGNGGEDVSQSFTKVYPNL